jgi:hypothetical protein
VRALLRPLFVLSAWAHTTTVVAGRSGEDAVLASVRSFSVGSPSHCRGGHVRLGRCSGIYSFRQHGLS